VSRGLRTGAVLLGLALLAFWMTWPWARDLTTSAYDPGGVSALYPHFVHPDIHLNVWIVGWVARTLPTVPGRLYDAGIYYPVRYPFAYSEHMLGGVPITLPVYWLTGSALAAHQALILAGFVLSGPAMALLVRFWTGSNPAAAVGGALYAFAPWRFRYLVWVQHHATFYLPLALLFASRFLRDGKRADAVAAGALLTAQALCAYSIAYALYAAMIPFLAVHGAALRVPWRRIGAGLAVCALSAVPVAAVSLPYLLAQAPEVAPVSAVEEWAAERVLPASGATPARYLDAGRPFYVGHVALALALGGLALAVGRPRRPVGEFTAGVLAASVLAFAAPLFVLSLGPYVELPGAGGLRPLARVWDIVPGLRLYRVPYRFGFQLALPVAMLGGLFAAVLERAVRRRWSRAGALAAPALGTVLVAAVCWGARAGPITLRRFPDEERPPAVYAWLAQQTCDRDACPVLELPAGAAHYADPHYVYWSLTHRLPLVNGYSGYASAVYPVVLSLAAQLPSAAAAESLARLTGVHWLVVHLARLPAPERTVWQAPDGPVPAARLEDDLVFTMGPAAADWRPLAQRPPADMTFAGTPLAPLPAEDRRGELRIATSPSVGPGEPLRVSATVHNLGARRWPAFTSVAHHRVALELRWLGARGVPSRTETIVFPRDIAPAEELTMSVPVRAPRAPGTYQLVATVVQEGVGTLTPDGAGRAVVQVTPQSAS